MKIYLDYGPQSNLYLDSLAREGMPILKFETYEPNY